MTYKLQYANIADIAADDFITHYDEVKGGFDVSRLPSDCRAGWSGDATAIDAATGNKWRYESPPQISSVRPGTSSVTFNLIGVL